MRLRSALAPFAGFTVLGLAVYWPALGGEFITDDWLYLGQNPYTASLSHANLRAILDPWGFSTLDVANFAPVHLLASALEWRLFGAQTLPYHLVNVVLHALCATLLVALLRRSGAAPLGALLAGTLFLVHPANVEAVAWISQLKTSAALALSFGALLSLRGRPALATALFAAALLCKPSAAALLAAAAGFTWARRGGDTRATWLWLGAWLLLLSAYAVPQLGAASFSAVHDVPEFADPLVQVRTMAAIGARYLLMAVGLGVSAFHEPRPALSWLDPYWLASLPLVALLGWRLVTTLRERSEEAGYWLLAAGAFAPISQILPFFYPVADRYLYFILPGLLGGTLLALAPYWSAPGARRAALAIGLLFCVWFAQASATRAALWHSHRSIMADAAANYPSGTTARVERACSAAQRGMAAAAAVELRVAIERGHSAAFHRDPCFAPIAGSRELRKTLVFMAGRQLEEEAARRRTRWTPRVLRGLAGAHAMRGEYDEARVLLERGIEMGGPLAPELHSELLLMSRLAAERREREAER